MFFTASQVAQYYNMCKLEIYVIFLKNITPFQGNISVGNSTFDGFGVGFHMVPTKLVVDFKRFEHLNFLEDNFKKMSMFKFNCSSTPQALRLRSV